MSAILLSIVSCRPWWGPLLAAHLTVVVARCRLVFVFGAVWKGDVPRPGLHHSRRHHARPGRLLHFQMVARLCAQGGLRFVAGGEESRQWADSGLKLMQVVVVASTLICGL